MKQIDWERWRRNDNTPYGHERLPIVLYWSPKAGCTTLFKWFLYQIDLLDEALNYDPWVHNYQQFMKSKQEYWDELKAALPYKDAYKLVRNPYMRAVSGYLMLIQFMPSILEDVLEELHQDRHSPKGLSFKQFLYYLKNKGVGYGQVNSHFAVQYRDGEETYIDGYLYLEDLAADLRKLERKYVLKECDLSRLTESHHHFKPQMIHVGSYADISFTDPTYPVYPTYDSFYDRETRKLVKQLYKKDFKKYGYVQ
jgi:hypothetical protein